MTAIKKPKLSTILIIWYCLVEVFFFILNKNQTLKCVHMCFNNLILIIYLEELYVYVQDYHKAKKKIIIVIYNSKNF